MKRRAALAWALLVSCLACATSGPAGAGRPTLLDGVFRSDGYGDVLVAKGRKLQVYEVTQTTCVKGDTLKAQRLTPPDVEAVYGKDEDVYLVRGTGDPDVKRFHYEGAASDMTIRRIAAPPAVCASFTPDTPEANLEVFGRTFSEHYILFDQNGVDWPATVAAARSRVRTATPPGELFEVFTGMIAPLENAHTGVLAPKLKRRFFGFRKGTDRLMKEGREAFLAKGLPRLLAVTDGKLRGPLRKWCGDQVQYAHLDETTGYLRILSEGGYTRDGRFDSGLAALEGALDAVFGDPRLERLVLDVRVNFGGADPYGLALASRLTTGEYVAYSKETRLDPEDRAKWTPGQPSVVRPSARPSFHGPVVELTGPMTISAGETTTQALMGRSPRILRIGESTQGVFSDVLIRRLPNGWVFGLPNEVFRSAEGKTYDGPGIPPDVEVPVFADDDVAAGRDPALERALVELAPR